jgi:hypothetical protein
MAQLTKKAAGRAVWAQMKAKKTTALLPQPQPQRLLQPVVAAS